MSDLFKEDRRNPERSKQTERRFKLRPTRKLKLAGALGAAIVLMIIYLFITYGN